MAVSRYTRKYSGSVLTEILKYVASLRRISSVKIHLILPKLLYSLNVYDNTIPIILSIPNMILLKQNHT